MLGIEILGANILAVKASPDMERALETETREKLQQEADQAIFERRNFAVEQEPRIKESELNTEIAIEEKRKSLIEQKTANDKKQAETQGYILETTLKPYKDLDWKTLTALTNSGDSKYKISFNNLIEEQSSSGLIVSTKAGSTGWLSSVFNMAYGITSMFERDILPKYPKLKDQELLFAVRESFKSIKTQIGFTAGLIQAHKKLVLESYMPTNGVIFSDGIERDFLRFNSGAIAEIGLAKETATLVSKN